MPVRPQRNHPVADSARKHHLRERQPVRAVIPGGFGWLTPDNSSVCGSTVTIASPAVSSKNGDSMPNGTVCKRAFTSLQGQTVFLPVFDTVTAAGDFHIKGFAAFQILGDSFPSQSWNSTGTIKCTGTCTGIIGKFVKFVSLATLQLGGAMDRMTCQMVRLRPQFPLVLAKAASMFSIVRPVRVAGSISSEMDRRCTPPSRSRLTVCRTSIRERERPRRLIRPYDGAVVGLCVLEQLGLSVASCTACGGLPGLRHLMTMPVMLSRRGNSQAAKVHPQSGGSTPAARHEFRLVGFEYPLLVTVLNCRQYAQRVRWGIGVSRAAGRIS